MIHLFTDGSSRGNPGPGGYGALLRYNQHEKELAEGFRRTTNNRMELLAVIRGLEAVKHPALPVTVVTDSRYVVDAVTKKWIDGWLRKPDFGGKANEDLWRLLMPLLRLRQVTFTWIRGHNGHPENERCDELAVGAALGELGPLKVDVAYEALSK